MAKTKTTGTNSSGKKLNVKIILGSTRPKRFSDKAGAWIRGLAEKRDDMDLEVLDLREWQLPFYNEDHSLGAQPGVYAEKAGAKWAKKIAEGDAYIVIAPEYNHGYPAVLKNALDYAYQEWNKKTVAFVAYGSVGGARSVEQLRDVAVELQMAPIRTGIHIFEHWNYLDEKGNLKSGALDKFVDTANGMLDQLAWWARALKAARENS